MKKKLERLHVLYIERPWFRGTSGRAQSGLAVNTAGFKAESLLERASDAFDTAPAMPSNVKLFVVHNQGSKGQRGTTFDTAHSAKFANIFKAT